MSQARTIDAPYHLQPLVKLAADPLRAMLALQRRWGDHACWQDGDGRLYFAFGPTANKQVLCDTATFHACFCPLRGPRRSAQRRVTHGLLSMNGEEHKQHRHMLRIPFQRPSLVEYQPAFAEATAAMLARWRTDEVRDIAADMNRLLLAITARLLFGIDDDGMALDMAQLLERYMEASHRLGIAAVGWHLREADQYEALLELANQVEDRMRRLIAVRRRQKSTDDSFLSVLLRLQGTAGNELSDDELIGHATLMFGAAQSTTAYTLTWSLVLGALHPEAVARVVPEVAAAVEGPRPAPASLGELPQLDRFIKESMRLLPASVYLQRVVKREVELGPFSLSPGETVVLSQWVTHRMRQYFSEPKRFLPHRWESLTAVPYSYIPFGMGPRLCIGNVWAMAILKTVLSMIWRRFDPQLCPDQRIDLALKATMLAPAGPVRMRLRPRGAATSNRTLPWGNLFEFVDIGRS